MDAFDPYKILELSKNFSETELKTNYKRLVYKHHPDKNVDNMKKTPIFQILTASYRMLVEELNKRKTDKPFHQLKEESKQFKTQTLNIAIDPAKGFNINKFNIVFEGNRIEDPNDFGYKDWMQNPDSFNILKHSTALTKYREPAPISSNTFCCQELGSKPDDFTNLSNPNLQYMDYRIAHLSDRIVDPSIIKSRKDYKTVKELENDRSKVKYTMSDKQHRVYQEQKNKDDARESERLKQLQKLDQKVSQHFDKVNKLMLGQSFGLLGQ